MFVKQVLKVPLNSALSETVFVTFSSFFEFFFEKRGTTVLQNIIFSVTILVSKLL